MGSCSSKFRKYLQNGDEYAALQVFQNSLELQNNLDPNSSYGDSLKHNTPLHLAALHAMKPLLRIFLTDLKGNPNKQNATGKTALHLVCQDDSTRSMINQERRAVCLNLILQWKNGSSEDEKVDVGAVDSVGNTALHYAAATGLKRCVEILISYGAPLFLHNKLSETACDLAEKNNHVEIAQYLETKMLFFADEADNVPIVNADEDEGVSGLRAQDLQEAKDQLLVETSDMFHVPLFTAEVLLRNHEWSRQSLLESWMKDPVSCCTEAGVSPPSSALSFTVTRDCLKDSCQQIQNEYQSGSLNSPSRTIVVKEEIMCDICTENISIDEDLIQIPCLHQFCKDCWKEYLTAKIIEGEAHNILCPAFQCPQKVAVDVIEKVVSADMIKRYLQFDIKAFVESNPTMKWCPYPSCARAVKVPKFETVADEIMAISFTSPPSLSHSVDCGNGHYFCWECLGEAHAPCGCENWKEWHKKIAEIKPQELKNTYTETEEAENSLWMVTNSKPCPNCKSPIQKNEGCNHMRCTKCKNEFCWVCLETWKKHSQATGGYFRCNRYDAVKRATTKTEALINEAEEHNKHMQELKRFLQYYSKYKNHEDSYKNEEPLLESISEKVNLLTVALASCGSTETNLSFLEDAVYELLRARRILCGACVYGFYLEDNGYNKTIFEYLQNDLEQVTGQLSDAITRTYLQTPQNKIVHMTAQVKRKRLDLLTAVHKGLIPPETPPSLRKYHRNHLPGLMGMDPVDDPLLSQAILESLKNFDPNDPWVLDKHGRHTNVAAVCDWPDYDSDEDMSPNAVLQSMLGICSRDGCNRPRAKNCRTGEMHEYCSLRCKNWKYMKDNDTGIVEASIDPSMDILIALEMSKLHMGQPTALTEEQSESALNTSTERTDNILLKTSETISDEKSESVPDEAISDPTFEHNLTTGIPPFENALIDHLQIDSNMDNTTPDIDHFNIVIHDSDETFATPVISRFDGANINFFLKDSDSCKSRNINVVPENNFSKTEKHLFKFLQKTNDISKSNENITNSEADCTDDS